MAHSSLVVAAVAGQGFTRNEIFSISASVTSQGNWGAMTGYLACPSDHWPRLDKEEKKECVVVENADSLAAPSVAGQSASKKQSSQLKVSAVAGQGSLSNLPELAT